MVKFRDLFRQPYWDWFIVVAINPPGAGEDKLRICDATGSCIDRGDPIVSRAPFSTSDPFATEQEAKQELLRLQTKLNKGCQPYYRSQWLRLEIWTVRRYIDALDNGE